MSPAGAYLLPLSCPLPSDLLPRPKSSRPRPPIRDGDASQGRGRHPLGWGGPWRSGVPCRLRWAAAGARPGGRGSDLKPEAFDVPDSVPDSIGFPQVVRRELVSPALRPREEEEEEGDGWLGAVGAGLERFPKRWVIVILCFSAFLLCNMDRVSVVPLLLAFFSIAGGIWADIVGGKLVLGFGVVWWSIATVLTPIAAKAGLPFLLVVRAFMGIGEKLESPAQKRGDASSPRAGRGDASSPHAGTRRRLLLRRNEVMPHLPVRDKATLPLPTRNEATPRHPARRRRRLFSPRGVASFSRGIRYALCVPLGIGYRTGIEINSVCRYRPSASIQIMQSIGFLGPAFFLTQLSHVHSPAMAVLCMACSQGVLLGLSNTAGVLAGVFGTAATGYILQHGLESQVLGTMCLKFQWHSTLPELWSGTSFRQGRRLLIELYVAGQTAAVAEVEEDDDPPEVSLCSDGRRAVEDEDEATDHGDLLKSSASGSSDANLGIRETSELGPSAATAGSASTSAAGGLRTSRVA
ncbi:hypothetical protein BHM03_00001611 [Ensete ventricosum]|nr:hypothetical protein BHM03_00001611 [Ensete ventricosum]